MHAHRLVATGFGLAALFGAALPAVAAPTEAAPELQQLKDQIAELRQAYEARLQALERRIAELQQTSSAVAAPPPTVPAAPASEPPRGTAASASAFNPAISLILNGTYAQLSRDPATYRIQGFVPSGGEVGPGLRSFQLGESELGLSANIDPSFSGHITFSLTGDDSVSVEEAVFERQGLFSGATLKAGRFLSSIGYLNGQHAHAWDFVDAPLAYQAFFGGPLKTDGVQLRWLAPAERFVELGAELGSGTSFPGNDTGRNGVGSTALFVHVGDDLGDSASWRVGASLLHHRAADRSYDDSNAAGTTVSNAFTGTSRTWVLDGIYKWAPGGNATRQNLKVQGEYFRRTENGSLSYDTQGQAGGPASGDYRSTQSGWYLQAVYQFMPMWRVGARYDRLDSGTPRLGLVGTSGLVAADFPILQSARPSRSTVMVDYSLSEFSRFRLQLAADRSNPAATDRQLFLQYIMSLGAHGAHSF
ncbi:hypothetical protein [Piscinibacter sp.]|uniref:hypothetical protein n=1 Tax=Piscinibacter sp. TaxID=1903157 RepID=UPI00355AB56D